MTPGAVKLRESLQLSWRVYLLTKTFLRYGCNADFTLRIFGLREFGFPFKVEPAVGFEPTTDGLQNRCSTTELNWLKTLISLGFLSVFVVEIPEDFQHVLRALTRPTPMKTTRKEWPRVRQLVKTGNTGQTHLNSAVGS